MRLPSRRYVFRGAIATVLCGTWAHRSTAQSNRTRRVAIGGYDPVAYFTDRRPIKGSPSFLFAFDEAEYHFTSIDHQKMFAADPDRYAPRFSGYCAIGVAFGHKAEVDPESWAISDGKLYLFHYKENTQDFAKDYIATESFGTVVGIVATADANWPAVKRQTQVVDHNDEIDRAAQLASTENRAR
jgi:hypothetical protein